MTAYGYIADEAFAEFQMQIGKFIDIVAPHRLGFESARFFTFGNELRINTLNHKDARGIVRDQRIERVHHQVQHFLEVQ